MSDAPSVLIVEDDPMIGGELAAFMTDLGYRVTGLAETTGQAMSLLNADPPNLMTVDVNLGEYEGGIALAILVRTTQPLPIIFVTGQDDPDTVERMMSLASTAVVAKPFAPIRLSDAIAQALARAVA